MAAVEMIRLHLLVVDDESFTRNLIERLLKEVDTGKISTAADGYEALAVMREEKWHVDAVLLDLKMPNMNGFAFIEKMRSEFKPPLSETPIIVISGLSDEKAISAVQELGVKLFLLKPISKTELVSRVYSAVKHKFE